MNSFRGTFKGIIILLCFQNLLSAQTLTLSGKVADEKTTAPLPFANIQLEGTNLGTITNPSGEFNFKIPEKYRGKALLFSYMGYKTTRKKVSDMIGKSNRITLEKDQFEIGEVAVMPDSFLLNLLKRAYQKIPENYPTEPFRQRGFYREFAKYPGEKYIYFAEAVIDMVKSSYQNSTDLGHVKIIKSANNEFGAIDSFLYRTIGGIFSADRYDFVKKRVNFLHPSSFKKYRYFLSGMTRYHESDVFVIDFTTRDDLSEIVEKGKIYLEKSSLAYIAIDYEITRPERLTRFLNSFIPKNSGTSVSYAKNNGKWYVKYVIDRDTFILRKKEVTLIDREYILTEIMTDSVKPIPLIDRIDYGVDFKQVTKEYYSDDYWEEYNVLKKDSILEKQIQLLYDTTQTRKLLTMKELNVNAEGIPEKKQCTGNPEGDFMQKYISFLDKNISRLKLRYGTTILPLKSAGGLYELSYLHNGKGFAFSHELQPVQNLKTFDFQYNILLNNKWAVNFGSSSSLNNAVKLKSNDLSITHRMLLNRWTNPLLFELSLGYTGKQIYQLFPTYRNNNEFSFGNKKIDAERIKFGTGIVTRGFTAQAGLNYRVSRRLSLFASAGYYFPVSTSQRLFLSEKSGFFLFRKNESIKLTEDDLSFKFNGTQTKNSGLKLDNLSFSFGLILNL